MTLSRVTQRRPSAYSIGMYAITGITGKVGGEVARTLLAGGANVRAVVRDARKGDAWESRGCEVALAAMEDAEALSKAFRGVEGVLVVPPPRFDPSEGFPEARAVAENVATALRAARPGRVVHLSTIGADAPHENLLSQQTLMETALSTLDIPTTSLRAAWFLDNASWDVEAAKAGVIPSYLAPLDRAIPMVAANDVGRAAADLLREQWDGKRIVELEGPARVSPNDIARAFAKALGHFVRAEIVPRDTWQSLFYKQGMKNPVPRMRMLDGFNEGWIAFGGSPSAQSRKGALSVDEVVAALLT